MVKKKNTSTRQVHRCPDFDRQAISISSTQFPTMIKTKPNSNGIHKLLIPTFRLITTSSDMPTKSPTDYSELQVNNFSAKFHPTTSNYPLKRRGIPTVLHIPSTICSLLPSLSNNCKSFHILSSCQTKHHCSISPVNAIFR